MATGLLANFSPILVDTTEVSTSAKSLSYVNPTNTSGIVNSSFSGTATHAFPTPYTRSVSGGYHPAFSDIFYNRIVVTELVQFDTGSSVTSYLQNLYLTQKTLTSVVPTSLTGLNIVGLSSGTLNAMQLVPYTIQYTEAAGINFNGTIQFNFSDAEDPITVVQGKRAIIFPFTHNWVESVAERVAYLTDVIEAKSGKEQRIKIRKYPRRQFEYKTLLARNSDDKDAAIVKAYFENLLFNAHGRQVFIPIVRDIDYLTSQLNSGSNTININTQYKDYDAGSYLILIKDIFSYEVCEILSMTSTSITTKSNVVSNWPAGTKVMPLKLAWAGNDTFQSNVYTYNLNQSILLFNLIPSSVQFGNIKTVTESVDTYKNYEVYVPSVNFDSDLSKEIYTALRPLDYNFGLAKNYPRYTGNRHKVAVSLTLGSRQEISKFFAFLDRRAGRWQPFWLPNFSNDIQLVQTTLTGSDTIKIKYIGYAGLINLHQAKRDLFFYNFTTKTYEIRRIIAATDNGDGTETLKLDSAFSYDVSNSTFTSISFLKFCRLDADTVELSWETDSIVNINFNTLELITAP